MIKETDYSKKLEEKGVKPIYVLRLMEKSGTEQYIYKKNGITKESGFPDEGSVHLPAFYYDYEDAVKAMHENVADIRECVYSYGLIIRLYPGAYMTAHIDDRTYFKWDDDKQGFYEAEEPELLRILAYGLG